MEANIGGPRSARNSRLVYAAGLDGSIFIVILRIENRKWVSVRSMKVFIIIIFSILLLNQSGI